MCCRCNGSGCCKDCSCRKADTACITSLLLRNGRCTNQNTCSNPVSQSLSQVDSGPVTLSFSQASLDTEAQTITNMDGLVHEDLLLTTSCSLPSFRSTSCTSTAIDNAYSRIVHWRPNLFIVPSGACGKHFVYR